MHREKLEGIQSIFSWLIISIAQSGHSSSEAAQVQQHACLREKIIDTFDGMEEVDCDAVYEDIMECMEYETNVKSFSFFSVVILVR